jgi:hypothetical protein
VVVVVVVARPHDYGTGEEYDRQDEDDAGDDDHPRRGHIERGRLDPLWRRGGDSSRHG